jgi:predicted nuclease with TOPRIM domain
MLNMDLKELLGEELYNQVMAKLGEKKIAVVSDGNWIPKDKFNELNDEKKALKEISDQLRTDLKEMKEKAKGNEDLTKQITALEAQLQENEDKIKDLRTSAAIERELLKANAKFPDLLVGKFDKSKVEVLEDGTVKGLEDQLKTIKESYKDLFGETKIAGTPPGKGDPPNPDTKNNPWKKETLNYTEQGRILREEPELAKTLKAAAGVK